MASTPKHFRSKRQAVPPKEEQPKTETQTPLEFLQKLQASGVRFLADLPPHGSTYDLTPEQVLLRMNDPDACVREMYGATQEHWEAFQAYTDTMFRCTGITKAGTPCRNRGDDAFELSNFIRGYTDRCHIHRDNSEAEKPEIHPIVFEQVLRQARPDEVVR